MLRLGIALTTALCAVALGISCGGDDFVAQPSTSSTGGDGGAGAAGGAEGGATSDGGGGMGGSAPMCFDIDMDGVTDCEGDCKDDDASVYPGAPELCGDALDNDCDTTVDNPNICMGIGTWVSALTGDDTTGDGTQASPLKSIAAGQANAVLLGPGHDVYVAEGHYAEAVDLIDGIDIWGGYQCDTTSCSWARDATTHVSQIDNPTRRGVYADITVRYPTTFDGFTVIGLDASGNGGFSDPGTSAVTISGGSPIISHNIIEGGDEGACTVDNLCSSRGIRISGPTSDPMNGAVIADNTIRAGSSQDRQCSAIDIHRQPSVAKIRNNVIVGGTCSWSRAVTAESPSYGSELRDNEIFAGTGGTSFAVYVSGYLDIVGNLINHDPALVGSCTSPGGFWCGGIEAGGAVATISNNVVFGMPSPKSIGIHIGDNEIAVGLVIVNANTIDGGGAAPGGSITTSVSTALACRTNVGNSGQIGYIRNNILLGGTGANRWGFIEEDDNQTTKACAPIAYENNDVFFAPQANTSDNAHRQWQINQGGTSLATIAEVNALPYANANIMSDPLLDATWHLDPGSPCIDAGTSTQAPSTDMDGEARPQGNGVDVGADEAG